MIRLFTFRRAKCLSYKIARFSGLIETLERAVPNKVEKFKKFKNDFGKKSLGSYTLNQCFDGGSDIPALFGADISEYVASNGGDLSNIQFRGVSLGKIIEHSSSEWTDGNKITTRLPETMLWLLFTSELGSYDQVTSLSRDLQKRSETLPREVLTFIQSLPTSMSVMTQLSMSLLYCQPESVFVKAYAKGLRKPQFWKPVTEDCLNIIAQLPLLVEAVYTHKYGCSHYNSMDTDKISTISSGSPSVYEYADRLTSLLFPLLTSTSSSGEIELMVEFKQFLHLFIATHCDHNNLSHPVSHAIHLTNCTLADPYKALSTGIHTVCGPRLDDHDKSLQLFQQVLDTVYNKHTDDFEGMLHERSSFLLQLERTAKASFINSTKSQAVTSSTTTAATTLPTDVSSELFSNNSVYVQPGLITVDPLLQIDNSHYQVIDQFIQRYLPNNEVYLELQRIICMENDRFALCNTEDTITDPTVRPTVAVLIHMLLHHYLCLSSQMNDEYDTHEGDGSGGYSAFLNQSIELQIKQTHDLYLLLSTVSLSFGGFAQIISDRALGLSLENIKSVDMDFIKEFYSNKK